MSATVTAIQTAADTMQATSTFIDAALELAPKIGWTTALAMAFIPKPGPDAPVTLRYLHQGATWIAGNFGKAANHADVVAKQDEQAP